MRRTGCVRLVRRLSLDLDTVESTVGVPAGSQPDGIASDGAGNAWVTLWNAGAVARFPAGQIDGSASVLAPTGGVLLSRPFGIAAGRGGMYVTGSESDNLVRIAPDGSYAHHPTGSGTPWQIVAGPDEDLLITDVGAARVLRFVNAPPRATTGDATVLAPTAANVAGSVDPRGNVTQVVFEYGTTTAYGSTAAAADVPAGTEPAAVGAALQGLAPNTTYHYRVALREGPAPARLGPRGR